MKRHIFACLSLVSCGQLQEESRAALDRRCPGQTSADSSAIVNVLICAQDVRAQVLGLHLGILRTMGNRARAQQGRGEQQAHHSLGGLAGEHLGQSDRGTRQVTREALRDLERVGAVEETPSGRWILTDRPMR